MLLESSDYHSRENSYSFICVNPLARFVVDGNEVRTVVNGEEVTIPFSDPQNMGLYFDDFISSINIENGPEALPFNGLYGYFAYNAVQYFDSISFDNTNTPSSKIPSVNFSFFKFVIAINHFNSELTIIENLLDGETSSINNLKTIIQSHSSAQYDFNLEGEESSNLTDSEFLDMIEKAKGHCKRGDFKGRSYGHADPAGVQVPRHHERPP